LSSTDFWAKPLAEREAAFAELRRLPEPPFFAEPEIPFVEAGPGYYALVKHTDVVTASSNPAVFSSAASAISITDLPREYNEFSGSMINMDDPNHCRLRRLVFRSFTQRTVAQLMTHMDAVAATVVDDLIANHGGDFVSEVAARLPLTVICDLMGIPAGYRDYIGQRSDIIMGGIDPDYAVIGEFGVDESKTADHMITAALELAQLVEDLARTFRRQPAGNVISQMCQPDSDGDCLTDQEIASFFILLVIAGYETTKNAISHGLLLLSASPGQRALWASDFDRYAPRAVEEIIRLSSPVVWMRRTLTQDFTLRDCQLRAGDKTLLFYWSANRDEEVFAGSHCFDISRDPNPHVGFGAAGHHFCLGARLARAQITTTFRELLHRAPDVRPCGEPRLLLSSFISGIKTLPCELTRARD
jgi:methyl-branched lipid omega-hydroxylase